MVDLPTKADLTSGSATEAEFQSAIGDLYDYVGQQVTQGDPYTDQIDGSGNVTPTTTYMQLDTNSLDTTDDLNHIVPTNIGKKMILVRSTSGSRVITIKHNVSGSGKIFLQGAADFVLRDPSYAIMFVWDDTAAGWQEIFRNVPNVVPAAEVAGIKTALGLGTAATKNTGISAGQIPLFENFGTAAFVNTGTSTGQVPLSNQLGALAFLSQVTDSQLSGTGVTPGTYNSVSVNAQGRVTAGTIGSTLVIRTRVFYSSATYIPHANMLYCHVEICAAGGGSQNGAPSAYGAGGGGGGGGYAAAYFQKGDFTSVAVTVGTSSVGGTGGQTIFGPYHYANGGSPGGFVTTAYSPGGGAGDAAGGYYNKLGDAGSAGGQTSSPNTGFSGVGGSSHFGCGGPGRTMSSGNAFAGGTGGGGAGGCVGSGAGSPVSGAPGGSGVCIITEYCSA